MNQPMESVNSKLRQLVLERVINPESMLQVTQTVEEELTEWKKSITSQLNLMIAEWEESMGETDQTFYSLGLRRAIDIISGQTAYSQLPILETAEYLPSEEE